MYVFLSLQEVKRRIQDLACPRQLLQDRRIDFPQPVHIYKSEVELELNIVKHEDPEFRWNPLKSDYVRVENNGCRPSGYYQGGLFGNFTIAIL